MAHDFTKGSLEELVYNKLQNKIAEDTFTTEYKPLQMAAYLFSNYISILSNETNFENAGFGGTFNFKQMYSILDALDIPNKPLNYQLTNIRASLERKFGVLKRIDSTTSGGNKIGVYNLPKDESELNKVIEWCYEKSQSPNSNYHRPKAAVSTNKPIYTEKNCDVFYGYKSGDTIWFSSDPSIAQSHTGYSIYVAFLPKGETINNMPYNKFIEISFPFENMNQIDDARNFNDRRTPNYFEVSKPELVQFMTNISTYGKYEKSKIEGWQGDPGESIL